VRLGARLDQVIDEVLKGNRSYIAGAIKEVYNQAYREGYQDGRSDCAEESVEFLTEEEADEE
jgi:hypothetical protein